MALRSATRQAARGTSLLSQLHSDLSHRWYSSASSRRLRAVEDLRRKRLAQQQSAEGPVSPPPSPQQLARDTPWSLQQQEPRAVALTDASLAPVFGNSALVVTRELEWGTLAPGFEQANRYTIRNADGAVVAYLAEETNSLASAVGRQLQRRRRPFVATLLNPAGDVIFRVRRPLYLINSSTVVEDSFGRQVGEIRAVWHLYKRQYDLFLHDTQFGAVRSGLLAWEFEVKDEQGEPLARVDRNFTGFARELFTDFGHYAVHFGAALQDADPGLTRGPARTAASAVSGGDALVPSTTDVWHPSPYARPLQLTERAACLALAIAADFDYFSQHSGSPGLMGGVMMPIPMPMPFPSGGGASDTASAGGVAGAGTEESPQQDEGHAEESTRPLERDWRDREALGGDEPFKPEAEQPTWSDKWFGSEEDEGDGDDGDDDEDGGGGGGFGTLGRVLGTIWDSNREE